ncbi:MAG TPA: alpha/beta fold hydrolase [Baekduia sp.]|nr:alpha/beta fold hydrolase [Baekduia sp.]
MHVGHSPKWLAILLVLIVVVAGAGLTLKPFSSSDEPRRLAGDAPSVDSFYTDPAPLGGDPGQLIREQEFTREIPANARASKIIFTTTNLAGKLELASGLVIAPKDGREPVPVILWAHGTTGLAQSCAPSAISQPFASGGMLVLDRLIDAGWAVVAPDYPGLGTKGRHPYLVGIPAARSALDAVRAARKLDSYRLSDKTVAWGHSQGGGVALWAGIEGRRYAPDVPLAGLAALAPATDLPALGRQLQQIPLGALFSAFVIQGYSNAYADVKVSDYIRPAAQSAVKQVVGRCLGDDAALASSSAGQLFSRDPMTGALATRLAQNTPLEPSGIPTLLAQGLEDELVLPSMQRQFVRAACDAGQPIDFRTYAGRGHVSLVAGESPLIADLLQWTRNRFDGAGASAACTTTQR